MKRIIALFVLPLIIASLFFFSETWERKYERWYEERSMLGWTDHGYQPGMRILGIDPQGRIWMTDRGLVIFDGKYWRRYNTTNNERFLNGIIDTIAFDKQKRVWIGFSKRAFDPLGGGIGIYGENAERLMNYTEANSKLISDDVTAIAFDQQERAWIGTREGVSVFDGENWTNYTVENSGLPSDHTNTLVVDAHNAVWIGTTRGLAILDEGLWTVYDESNSDLSDNEVTAIVFDERERAWIGTRQGGVNVLNGADWTTYNRFNSGLAENFVRSITLDKQHRIWIDASEAISVFDGQSWTNYTRWNSCVVFPKGVAVDQDGNIWVGGNRSCVASPDLPKPVSLWLYIVRWWILDPNYAWIRYGLLSLLWGIIFITPKGIIRLTHDYRVRVMGTAFLAAVGSSLLTGFPPHPGAIFSPIYGCLAALCALLAGGIEYRLTGKRKYAIALAFLLGVIIGSLGLAWSVGLLAQ